MLFTFSYNSLYDLIDGGSRVQNQHGTVKKFSLHTLEMDIPLVCKNLSSFLRFRIFKKLFRDFAVKDISKTWVFSYLKLKK